MLSKVKSCGLNGIDGYIIEVETDISNGIPVFDIVGLGGVAVKESRERVRAAIKNMGLEFPTRRITINLAPANLKKEGSSLDLPIALGILLASKQIEKTYMDKYILIGELSLNGDVRPIKGVLPIALCAYQNGIENIILPDANKDEAAVIKGINVFPVKNIEEVINHLSGRKGILPYQVDLENLFDHTDQHNVDLKDVRGQENVKRALEIAASGAHNMIMIGSPGCGKTMLAKRLPTILPNLTFEEALEVTKIHSIAGLLSDETSLVTKRPFRSPHHTMSNVSLIGGGRIPKPGEISLSHYGVLFLDELPEFKKEALEVLRQPLEDGRVVISRVNSTITYPSKATLICAANPCKCGNLFEKSKECICTPHQVKQYLGKISGPLLDRMDIHIEVSSVTYNDLNDDKQDGESSFDVRERVNKVRKIQMERYRDLKIFSNSELESSLINRFCKLDDKCKVMLKNAFESLGLSARAHSRILKVARTIADMDGSEQIKMVHLAEAIQYRSLDRKFWSE